ncbi:MAG TPA: MCE family protein, partial [Ignavibacteria bacterium]|nr:MCE family protein [Ignavibacteria bacterium]
MTNKDTRKFKLKVGYTVFAGLVIFFLFIIMVGTEGYYFSKTYNLNLLVKSTEGLIEGSKVSLGGLKIGQIDKIEFTTVDNQNLVKIKLALLKKYSSQITVNSFAKIETSGLLGDKLINISLGNPSERALNEGEYLPVKESFSLESISDKVEPLITNINDVVMNLKIFTDTLYQGKGIISELTNSSSGQKFNSLIKNLDEFSAALNRQQGTLGKLTYDSELYSNLNSLVSNFKSISDSLKSGKGTVGKFLTQDSLYNKLNDLAGNLNSIFSSAGSDSTIIKGLVKDKKLYVKLNNLI